MSAEVMFVIGLVASCVIIAFGVAAWLGTRNAGEEPDV
jgi:hypothetical protein